jgi:uncharacterized protein (TIGR03435 family)
MNLSTVRAGLLVVASCLLYGQTADTLLSFDAASVKLAASLGPGGGDGKTIRRKTGRDSTGGGPGTDDPGRIHYPRVTLKNLMTNAWDVKNYQVAGPGWLDTEWFAVDAIMPPETTKEQFRVMLQNLLVERFRMTIHRETKELPIYALLVASNGPKMNGSSPAIIKGPNDVPLSLSDRKTIVHAMIMPGPPPPGYRWIGWQATMSDLAKDLADELHRPVADATALKAKYNFTLNFSREAMSSPPPPGGGTAEALAASASQGESLPDIFSALQSIGLKLEQKKGPVAVIVIDHVERTPTGN